YDFASPKIRLTRLRESIEIIKRLFTDDKVTFDGDYYHLKSATNYPKPIQKPYPPIMIAGSGENITLRIVAEHADKSNFTEHPSIFKKKLGVLQKHCRDIGRDYNSIEKTYLRNILVGKTKADAEQKMKKRCAHNDTIENFKLFNTWGDPESIINHFTAYRKLGVTSFQVFLTDIVMDHDAIQLFSDEIIPGVN
ncbi:MAG: LLM class flavin-dependent oxidoreductase, partial [Candidatus Heimdallarchaeota archaeon]|nr:LLM class flavin-dependent oxidoreductase [Candidatus Heimdallarchaeota archaeon]